MVKYKRKILFSISNKLSNYWNKFKYITILKNLSSNSVFTFDSSMIIFPMRRGRFGIVTVPTILGVGGSCLQLNKVVRCM